MADTVSDKINRMVARQAPARVNTDPPPEPRPFSSGIRVGGFGDPADYERDNRGVEEDPLGKFVSSNIRGSLRGRF